ncbi:MAG: bifunctional demethylmenaquinone methyltransferase/2-methoxy-6-polyprenyl-1,4-benzoquinol methylase UbiE [Thermodesulfobacteriota bacterium]
MKKYFLHPESIRNLFDRIAPTYDFLNHLLSLGRDVYWRKRTVQDLEGVEGWVLDVATGTGELAIKLAQLGGNQRRVVGIDFSKPMLRRAYRKISSKGFLSKILLGHGDALFLPFKENVFSASVVAFGLRNILHKEQALEEMIRVVKEGGKVMVLEFTLPTKGMIKLLYLFYFQRILPWLGGLISGDREAYAYLPKSVSHFPDVEDYERMLKKSGLGEVVTRKLTFGVVSLISGTKKGP